MGTPHVAVIVVHGVGDPGENSSVDNVASMLLAHREGERTRYQPFTCQSIQVGVSAAPVAGTKSALPSDGLLSECPPAFANGSATAHAVDDGLPDDVAFTSDQLREYKAGIGRNETTYATTRVEGVRRALSGGTSDKVVHLYELYWADLVSVRKGLRLFEDVYQLILHTAHIGLLMVYAAMAKPEFAKMRSWKCMAFCHRWAVRVLTLLIPILNLMALPIAMYALTSLVHDTSAKIGAIVLCALLALLSVGVVVFLHRQETLHGSITMLLATVIIAGAVWLVRAFAGSSALCASFLAISAFGLGMAGVLSLLAGYDKIRPGAFPIAVVAATAVIAITLYEVARAPSGAATTAHFSAALWAGGNLLSLLGGCWSALFILSLLSALFAMQAICFTKGEARGIAIRFSATALLTLSMPMVGFFILTTFISTAMLYPLIRSIGTQEFRPGGFGFEFARRLMPGLSTMAGGDNMRDVVQTYWAAIAATPLVPLLVLVGLALLLVIWTIAPSVLSEWRVPRDGAPLRRAYAAWLDRSRVLLWIAGGLVYTAALLITPAAVYAVLNRRLAGNWTIWLFGAIGSLIAGAGTISLLPGRLGKFVGRASVPIRAALDIDAYLRSFPRNANPKARIFARYCSLLRYITNWCSPADPNVHYDSIVVIAHSQGTAISADLFRYLAISGASDSSLERLGRNSDGKTKMPLRLLTLGCPLRQLYRSRFPHLYAWVTDPAARKQMGLHSWINGFRSGDYVGRNLWRDGAYWDSQYSNGCVEFCAGPGAHVHYWDGSAKSVADALDDLINS